MAPNWLERVLRGWPWCSACSQRRVAEPGAFLCVTCQVDLDLAIERLTGA